MGTIQMMNVRIYLRPKCMTRLPEALARNTRGCSYSPLFLDHVVLLNMVTRKAGSFLLSPLTNFTLVKRSCYSL